MTAYNHAITFQPTALKDALVQIPDLFAFCPLTNPPPLIHTLSIWPVQECSYRPDLTLTIVRKATQKQPFICTLCRLPCHHQQELHICGYQIRGNLVMDQG
jgi:hypothetical protein